MHTTRLISFLQSANRQLVPFPRMKEIDKNTFELMEAGMLSASAKERAMPDTVGSLKAIKFAPCEHVTIDIQYHPEIKAAEEKGVKPALAYSVPIDNVCKLDDRSKINNAKVIYSQSLLRQKEVPDDFNLLPAFYDSEGRFVFLKAEVDLFEYCRKMTEYLSLPDVKGLIADVVLALYDLHSRNLVHRDIKTENFLLFRYNGQLFLKLGDHDTLREVDSKNQLIGEDCEAGTWECLSPEIEETNRFAKKLDLKAVDLYAIGVVICEEMLRFLAEEKVRYDIEMHFNYLLNPDPCQRKTINDLMNCEFFGNTKEIREAYFATRRKNAFRKIHFNGEQAFPPPVMNNPVLMLDQTIKPIYKSAVEACEEIKEADKKLISLGIDKTQCGLSDKIKRLEHACSEKYNPEFKQFVTEVVIVARQDAYDAICPEAKKILLAALDTALAEYKREFAFWASVSLFKPVMKTSMLDEAKAFVQTVRTAMTESQKVSHAFQDFFQRADNQDFRSFVQGSLERHLLQLPLTVIELFDLQPFINHKTMSCQLSLP